jgi:hypothetical protein
MFRDVRQHTLVLRYRRFGTIYQSNLPRSRSPTLKDGIYRGADTSLARPIYLSIVFSVQGTGGSPTGPDPENRVGDQDIGSPRRPVSSGLQVHGEQFPSWSG